MAVAVHLLVPGPAVHDRLGGQRRPHRVGPDDAPLGGARPGAVHPGRALDPQARPDPPADLARLLPDGGSAQGGVVLAASYEAKVHGVSGGMPGWRARQLCPRILFVRGHFGEYQRLADAVVDLFYDVTPAVERISIDEAFLDVAGATHLFGPPEVIAESLRRRVRTEVGLPISVGVA